MEIDDKTEEPWGEDYNFEVIIILKYRNSRCTYTGCDQSIGPPIIQNMAYFDRFMQKL